jgi:uncharacterized membrane protein YraQ (UPF0718 family)
MRILLLLFQEVKLVFWLVFGCLLLGEVQSLCISQFIVQYLFKLEKKSSFLWNKGNRPLAV